MSTITSINIDELRNNQTINIDGNNISFTDSFHVDYTTTYLDITNYANLVSVSDSSGYYHSTSLLDQSGNNSLSSNNTITFKLDVYDTDLDNSGNLIKTESWTLNVVVDPDNSGGGGGGGGGGGPPPNNDATLSVFTIDGDTVTDGSTVNKPYGTTSVTVVATPTDSNASVEVIGDTDLVTGNTNTVTVNVTAADGITQQQYNVTINVAEPSNDISLSVFTIDGSNVSNGDTVYKDFGTTSVTVVATPTDSNASVGTITGFENLETGDNYLTFDVTAQDGTTHQQYNVTINVANDNSGGGGGDGGGGGGGGGGDGGGGFTPSNDTSLSVFTIDGSTVIDGSTIGKPYGTTSVTVVATPTSNFASVGTITGFENLETGSNNLTFVVTAQNANYTQRYDVTIIVAEPSTDTSLSVFTIDNSPVNDQDYITESSNTTSVFVIATPTDSNASISNNNFLTGDYFNLTTGENYLTFTVTAEDGTTQYNYSVTINVPNDNSGGGGGDGGGGDGGGGFTPSNDTSLSVFTIDGDTVTDGSTVNKPYGTPSVTVVATPTSNFASVGTITGFENLETGSNNLTFVVTAQNANYTQRYDVTIIVAEPSSDKSLSVFTIDGSTVSNGGTVNKPYNTTSVTVVATPTSNVASVGTISGDTGLHTGSNNISFTVTAQNGSTQNYSVTVVVASSNNNGGNNILCFHEDTNILCFIDNKDVYIPIKNIRKGTLVKTKLNGYVPVDMIGQSKIYNPSNTLRSINRLYKCSPNKYPELTEDLIITGCHSILVDEITDKQRDDIKFMLGRIMVTDNKYRLMACLDEKAETYEKEGIHNIWHLALENNDYYMNYGIYANGLLVETTSKRMIKELSGLQLLE